MGGEFTLGAMAAVCLERDLSMSLGVCVTGVESSETACFIDSMVDEVNI